MRTKASTWRNENHFYDWLPISSAFQNHHHQRQHRLQKNRGGVPVSLPRYRSVFRRLVRMLYHAVGAHRHRLISAVLVVVAVTTLISWRALVPRGDGPRDHGELVREAQMNAERARLMQYPWGTYLRRKAVNVWSELTTSMTCLHRAVEDGRRDRENGFEGWKQSCQEGLASSTWPITAEARQSDFCEDVARVPERLRGFRVPKPAGVGWRDMFLNVLPYMENSHAVEYVLYNHFGSSESIFNTGIEDEANAFLFPAQPYLVRPPSTDNERVDESTVNVMRRPDAAQCIENNNDGPWSPANPFTSLTHARTRPGGHCAPDVRRRRQERDSRPELRTLRHRSMGTIRRLRLFCAVHVGSGPRDVLARRQQG